MKRSAYRTERSGAVDVLILVRVESRMAEDCLKVENRVRVYELSAFRWIQGLALSHRLLPYLAALSHRMITQHLMTMVS
jgi:hypothetical protein